MKLLLHTCCAPCLIYPLERLKAKGFRTKGFFYNPNIQPVVEYNNRRQAVEILSKQLEIEIIYPQYSPIRYFQEINQREEKPQRCFICWRLRLKEAAQQAKAQGMENFSTTLLVSPYQDQDILKKIGETVAEEEQIDFYYEDFRPGFRKAHNKAKAMGLYCQRYCGCIYSQKKG
jgi:predicted adenine nucleotide alpha hydrolase (AANH) superfamily ATPase